MNKIGAYLALLLVSLMSCTAQDEKKRTPSSPNIILIMTDDLGWGDTGFNGNTEVLTPNLDKLAASGVILNRFYAGAPVCSPTRASCLTGRNPNRMGIYTANAGHMKPEEITLPELLHEQGYRTGHFGKWHLGTLTTKIKDANRGKPRDSTHYAIPTDHGYDTYFCTESKVPTYDPMLKPKRFQTELGESLRYGWDAAEHDTTEIENYGTWYWSGKEKLELENLEGDNSKVIMDRVIPFIEHAVQREKPFFTTIWFHTPHLPVVTSEKYRKLYAQLSHEKQLYLGAITAMDEQVGRLWEFLQKNGEAANTMIWFCSDNGPERQTPGTAGPFRERKRSLYEGGLRVPAFVLWQNQIRQKPALDFPMFTSDYLPTILDFLELEYPHDSRPLDGLSLRYVFEGKKKERSKAMGFMHRTGARSWVNDRYKLIRPAKDQAFELYDLLEDKEEKNNIAEMKPGVLSAMQAELTAWLLSVEKSDRGEDY